LKVLAPFPSTPVSKGGTKKVCATTKFEHVKIATKSKNILVVVI
jgi:hypothetical protein